MPQDFHLLRVQQEVEVLVLLQLVYLARCHLLVQLLNCKLDYLKEVVHCILQVHEDLELGEPLDVLLRLTVLLDGVVHPLL